MMIDSSLDKSIRALAQVRPCTDWGPYSSRAVRLANADGYKSSSENSSALERLIRVLYLPFLFRIVHMKDDVAALK